MIKLRCLDLESMGGGCKNILDSLPEYLKSHVLKKKLEDERHLSALGYAVALEEATKILGKTPKISFSEGGKPYFEDAHLFFSISHSGKRVVCAVSDRKIGADIEKITQPREGVASRFFTEDERQKDFFEIWTKKEAYGKCLGDMAKALSQSVLPLSFYTENDGEYAIAVYEE